MSISLPPLLPVNDAAHRRFLLAELLVVLVLGVLPHAANAVLAVLFERDEGSYGPIWARYVMGSVVALQISLSVAWIMFRSGTPIEEFGIKPFKWRTDLLLALGICVCMYVFAFVSRAMIATLCYIPSLERLIHAIAPPDAYAGGWATPPDEVSDLAMMLIYDVANGFSEELVIRCYLLTRLAQLFGVRWTGVVLSAAIMSSYHIYQGSYSANQIFLSQIGVGALFVYVRRLWPFAMAHALFNLTVIAAS